ncbi:hypothetical protein PR048_011251 [Dryococelus australis]|uniref:Uncharacterized protein n=1 Tax=Dryococelus australis TaxID=614101 RepID=A0ABQ9HLJ8_9NEOP|nr:hypothetical protein PR048_011251 [Dryococelus australis]
MKTAENKELEEAVLKRVFTAASIRKPSLRTDYLPNSKSFSRENRQFVSFKASNGMLRNFKARNGIRELDLSGEKLSADPKAVENFIEKFQIEAESYDPELLYNADETGLI